MSENIIIIKNYNCIKCLWSFWNTTNGHFYLWSLAFGNRQNCHVTKVLNKIFDFVLKNFLLEILHVYNI